MCGIAGAWRAEGPADVMLVAAMLARLRHRGPDGAGLHLREEGGLGHHRLALHDLSAAGLQPMVSADGAIAIAVNGTFHNAPELRAGEEARGHRFRSRSDSEVLIPLYRRLGPRCVEELRGPFAIALIDYRERRLLLARDRLGEKPLFVAAGPDGILFASELGALLAALPVRTFEPGSAAAFLQAGYVPEHRTVVAEAWSLPPASRLVGDAGGVRTERYWDVPEEDEEAASGAAGERAAHRAFAAALAEAVRIRLRTERSLGVLLSGGLDSTSVLALATEAARRPIPSFTLGFDERGLDERPPARAAARHLGSPHEDAPFRADVPALLEELIARSGELSGDPSLLALAEACRLAAPHATLLLSGDGGDELLLGYRRHALAGLARARVPAAALALLGRRGHGRLAAALRALPEGEDAVLADLAGLLPRARWRALVRPELQGPLDPLSASYASVPARSRGAARAGRLDLLTYLPGDLLPKADRASMFHGVELWSPFLDHVVVETASRIPARHRRRLLRGKRPLRTLLSGRVPRRLRARRKRGFATPLAAWLASGPYAKAAREILGGVRAPFEPILRTGTALPHLEAFQRGDRGLAPFVHACVVLALFHEKHLRRD